MNGMRILFTFSLLALFPAFAQGETESFYTSCRNLPLLKEADALSAPLKLIPFGSEVTVLKYVQYYELPQSARKNTGGENADAADMDTEGDYGSPGMGSDETEEQEKVPAWAKVQIGDKVGFVSFRCLVDKDTLERQDPTNALRKAKGQDVSRAGKGFSEQEDGDLVAMKGAAGKARSGVAAYGKIDKILSLPTQYNRKDVYASFRKQGRLGEFQK